MRPLRTDESRSFAHSSKTMRLGCARQLAERWDSVAHSSYTMRQLRAVARRWDTWRTVATRWDSLRTVAERWDSVAHSS
jgi:hypothetical protein